MPRRPRMRIPLVWTHPRRRWRSVNPKRCLEHPFANSVRDRPAWPSSRPTAFACPSWPCSPSRGRVRRPSTRRSAPERPAAGGRTGRVRRARPDRPDPPRPGGDALRTGPGRRREVGPRRGAVRRHRPLDERRGLPGERRAGPQRHRHRAAQRPARDGLSARPAVLARNTRRPSQVLPLALGETIGGEPYIVDLAKMPHLLIAGTTGSGKSVGVNAMILSILYRLPPEEVPVHHDRPEDAGAVGL